MALPSYAVEGGRKVSGHPVDELFDLGIVYFNVMFRRLNSHLCKESLCKVNTKTFCRASIAADVTHI